MKRLRERLRHLKIRYKLVFIFLVTSMIAFGVNLFVYLNLNRMLSRIDMVYSTNISLNDLSDDLAQVHSGLTGFLETKGTDDLELYYKYSQEIAEEIQQLNNLPTDNVYKLRERNIRKLAESYLLTAENAVKAKRGRNIEKYTQYYKECSEMYDVLNTYIYSLNNETFRINSESFNTLIGSLRYSEILCLSIFVIVSLMNVLLIVILTGTITKPLTSLSDKANEISRGGLENVEPLKIHSNDEVGNVTRAFNQMLASIKEYIAKIREQMVTESAMKEKSLLMENQMKDAQLKYLQAQINPHFLFNTLNAGAQLAMVEGADRTGEYISNMADFFRYNVKKDNEQVKISEEIELVDSYIYIMNVRYSGEIKFSKDIDESLTGVVIPSMIIQPIVENSVKYGIMSLEDRQGHIILSLYEEDGYACIEVSDNGTGMDEELIEDILAGRPHGRTGGEPAEEKSVGLANVISRLDIFFDKKEKIEIKSTLGEGTSVIIRIPMEKDQCTE